MNNSLQSTALLPVTLFGLGTAEVESFPSYLHRIAYDHGVYVGVLIRYLYRNEKLSGLNDLAMEEPKYLNPNELVRPYGITNMLIGLFERATGQHLATSTLQFLNGPIGRSSGEVIEGFRWCPECFREIIALGHQPYFKLIWHMSAVKACPIHRTPLANECQSCGCSQKTYIRKFPIEYCQSCGVSLAKRQIKLLHSDICKSWVDIGFDVIQFFRDMASDGYRPLPMDGLQKSLDKIFSFYWSKGREEDFYNLLSRDELLLAIDGEHRLSFLSVRRVAQRVGIPIYMLLSGKAEFSTEMLQLKRIRKLPDGLLEVNKKSKKDHVAILSKIRRYLRGRQTPPSVPQVATATGVSIGYLEYRHPTLVAELVAKHQAYEQQQKLKKVYHAQSAALRFFLDEKYSAITKSRKQAYKTIRDETGLPKFLLRRAVQNAYAVIYRD